MMRMNLVNKLLVLPQSYTATATGHSFSRRNILSKPFQFQFYSSSSFSSTSIIKNMSTSSQSSSQQQQINNEIDVITEVIQDKGIITLNRPRALNALNLSMIRKIYPKLREWESSKTKFVIIKGEGEKAFCAGGDIIAVTESAKKGTNVYKEFFKEEYMLNALIGTLTIPYIALIDGITMGGGVGLSVHGRYRVATEKTLFAMPETAIGLFPDVGGTYFLPRLGGKLGLYLALTGYRLKGGDNLKAGVATHMCNSSMLDSLEQDLISLNSHKPQDIEVVLKKYNDQSPEARKPFTLDPHIKEIDHHFSKSSIEEIISSLKSDGSEWAQKTVQILEKMSPTSVKISLEGLERGNNMDLVEALAMEYRMAIRCCEDHDFTEGVRALLVDKDQSPKWKPETFELVTPEIVDKYFSSLPDDMELVL